MTTVTQSVVQHQVLDPTASLHDAWNTYAHIYCHCDGGLRVLLLYLRPDCEQATVPWTHNRCEPASGFAVLFFHAWQFAGHRKLFASGRNVQVEIDAARPQACRVFATFGHAAPTTEPVPDVAAWLRQRPDVYWAVNWQALAGQGPWEPFDRWTPRMQADFLAAFAAAWNHQPIALADPPPSLGNYDPASGTLTFCADDAWRMYCAHAAFSLAVEMGSRVPWSITAYAQSDLRQLLSGRDIFWWNGALLGYELQLQVVPMPPERAWAFFTANDLIAADRVATIGRVIDWCRDHLRHFLGGSALAQTPQLVSAMVDGTVDSAFPECGVQHWTLGCAGTTAFLKSLLRTLNVVVEGVGRAFHSLVHFTADDLYLSHGDDPYNQACKCTPSFDATLLLIDRATFMGWFGPQVPDAEAEANVARRAAELAVAYLSDRLLNLYSADQRAGKLPQNGQAYQDLQRYYPQFTDLYPDLWQRMDARLASFGSVDWPACGTYDADIVAAARAVLAGPPAQAMPADDMEANDDFATAKPVALAVPGGKHLKVQKDEFRHTLNFSTLLDADFFKVGWQCGATDDPPQGTGPARCISTYLGLWLTHHPPEFYVTVRPQGSCCVDLEIYREDAAGPALVQRFARTNEARLPNPTPAFGGRGCYVVVKNSDPAAQGVFAYELTIGYASAYDTLKVDTHAPAYRPRTSIERKFLKELYSRIDLPRPPEEQASHPGTPGERFVHGAPVDVHDLAHRYHRFLEAPGVSSTLALLAHKDSHLAVAEAYGNLARAAESGHAYGIAEHLYLKSARAYSSARQAQAVLDALEPLAAIYHTMGAAKAARRIERRIAALKAR